MLRVGYEGGVDEKSLGYYPDTSELDLTSWRSALEGHAGWDIWNDQDVPGAEELERRLEVLGVALRAHDRGG